MVGKLSFFASARHLKSGQKWPKNDFYSTFAKIYSQALVHFRKC